MRKMRKFLNILFLCTLALGLSSCEPDDGEDYYIYDTLLGGIWVGDLGFADFVNKLKYEASKAGSSVIEIDRFYPSSQICSNCGYQNKETKDLKLREWDCPECGIHHDRDINAAINILREGERIFLAS